MTKFGCFTSLVLTLLFLLLQHTDVQAQKYWRGGSSNKTANNWHIPENWSPVGVPLPTDSVVIGDAGFTSGDYPEIEPGNTVSIKALTIGPTKTAILLLGASDLTVSGSVLVGPNGVFENYGSAAYYSGNFEVKAGGIYKETGYSSNPGYAWGNTTSKIWPYTEFLGTGKTILFPSSSMGFSYLKISGSVKMLSGMTLIKVNRVRRHKSKPDEVIASDNPKMYVSGTFNPMGHTVAFDGTPTFVVEQSGTIYVKAVNYKENYAYSSTGNAIFPVMDPLGTVNYNRSTADSFTSGNQNVLSSQQYGVLRISGTGVKTLEAPVGSPVVQTSIVSNLFVDAGTLDIVNRSLNRTASGGTMYVANGATFRLSGVSNFPINFTAYDLGPTSITEYYGGNQDVKSVKYGHLYLTGPDADATVMSVKTMDATPMIVSGDLKVFQDASFIANNTIQIDGNVSISNVASFNGGTGFTHIVGGNWTNDADFTGNTSTVRLIGTGKVISRTANVTATLKNEFNNLEVAGLGTTITIPGTQTLVIKGNLSTTGAGTLTQSTGSLTMEGAAKTISGNSIVLNDFIANGSTTTTTSFTVKGNFTVNSGKSFVATGGTITMAGDGSKNIINNATSIASLTFFGLRIDAKTLTNSSFYIDSDLSGNNLTATTAGTVEFRGGIATFAGTHNLFDVVVSGSDRRMVTNSNMGIAGKLTVTGLLNVTANIPNTVTYNGTIAQTVAPITYHHLVFDKTGAKKTVNALTVNGNLEIKSGSNFNAGDVAYTHTIYGNWIDAGTFTAGTGTIVFAGTSNTTITGATTFNDLKIIKANVSNFVSLNGSDITTNKIYLTTGFLKTGAANRVIVLVDRYDTGWIEGTITRRLSSFNAGTSYLFNGPYVAIKFGAVTSPITEISVTSNPAVINFPGALPINRLYKVVVADGSYTKANIKLQYEDSELNGNTEGGNATGGDEDGLKLSFSNLLDGTWSLAKKIDNNYTQNWVEDSVTTNANGYDDLNKYWVISDKPTLFKWKGETSTAWETGSNWYKLELDGVTLTRSTTPPTSSDIAELGGLIRVNQPLISTAVYIKSIQFKPASDIELTLSDSYSSSTVPILNVKGNLVALEVASQIHKIYTQSQKIDAKSSLILDNGNHQINIINTTGEIAVNGNIAQSIASVNLGSGFLKIKGDYNYTGGTFTTAAAAGTVVYEGGNAQTVANVPYYHLSINKSGGVAQYNTSGSPIVKGNLTITAGTMLLQESNALTVNGNIIINVDGVLNANTANINAKGDWTRSTAGKFIPGTGTVSFIGAGAQNLTGSPFNNLIINNGPSGYATVTSENAAISGDLTIASGKLLLNDGLTMNRTATGGKLELAGNATLELKGYSNFPANFNTNTIDSLSTVVYSGTSTQLINPLTYGKITIQGSGSKLLTGTTNVLGDLKVLSASASLNGNGQTLTINKNFYNYGVMYYPSQDPTTLTGTLVLAKSDDTPRYVKGIILANNLIVQKGAHYTFTDSLNIVNNIDIDGDGDVFEDPNVHPKLRVLKETNIPNNGYLEVGDLTVSIGGNFKGAGFLLSKGVAIFTGTRTQTIQLLAPIIPIDFTPPTVVFAGSVSPILNSTRSPEFGSVIISNTGGVTASVGWTIFGLLEIRSSDSNTPTPKIGQFHGASYTHNIYTAIVNGGVLTSSGLINFNPIDQGKVDALKTKPYYPLQFGGSPKAFVSTGTLRIGGDQPIALLGALPEKLNNLIIGNKNVGIDLLAAPGLSGAAIDTTKLPLYGSGWNILGNMTIESGAIFNGGKILVYNSKPNATTGTNSYIDMRYNISGNLINSGVLAAGDATFIMKGSNASISGTGSTTFGNLTIDAGAGLEISKNINIKKHLTHKGSSFKSTSSIISFIGADTSLISSSVSPLSLSKTKVDKDTNVVPVYLKTGLDKVLLVDVVKGILDVETNAVVQQPDITEGTGETATTTTFNSILAVANGATIKIGGISTLPNMDSTALAINSNVVYYGGDQEVKNVQYGNLRLENTLGLDKQKTFLPADGTTKIAGSFVLDKTATSGVARDRVTAPATIEYNGGDQQIAGIDYNNLSLTTGGAKTLNDIVGVADAFTNTGAATVDAVTNATTVNYNGTVAQNVLPLNYHHLEFNNSGVKTLLAGETGIAGDFTVTTPSTNLAINATTVNFNGDGAQKVAAVDYDNLRFSVKGKKTITGAGATVNVKNSLLLSTGSVSPLADNVIEVITGSNRIVLNQASGTISEGENAYVTGFVETQRTMTTALENFGGLGIEINPTLAPGLVTIVRETGRAVGPSNNSILRNYSFVVADVNSKLDARVTFHYFTHELNTLTESTLQLFNSLDGVKWYSHPNSIPNETNNDLIATGVPTLRRMTLASTNTPLPVELIYFKAEKNGSEALLTWETATEEDNKGFGIEVSEDGFSYREIGFVSQGTGTTRAAIKYTFKDVEQGKNGMRYYRLRQQDFDGKVTYYGPRTLAFEIVKEVAVYAYPNPFQSNLTVNVSAVVPGQALVEVYNVTGQRLVSQSYQVKAGVTSLPLSVEKSIAQSGIYFVTVEINGQKHRLKVVRK